MSGPLTKRILIVNPFGIGDVLFTTPMVESISSYYPQGYIGYLCNIRTAPLLISNPNINKVFIFEKDEYRQLWGVSWLKCISKLLSFLNEIKKERFDIAFDLSLAQEYGLFLKFAGIRQRLGYNYRNRGIFLTKKIELTNGYADKHIVDYYSALLSLIGIRPVSKPLLNLFIPEQYTADAKSLLMSKGIFDNDKFVCIIPGGGASWGATSFCKHWPTENFFTLAKSLCNEARIKVILLGSLDDKPLCDYVKNREPRCINLCGETSLLVFAAIIKKADLIVTNDGGPLHIAVATGTKTVSIFGPVDDKVYGPYPPQGAHAVIKNEKLDCRPCYKNFKMAECLNRDCLYNVSPDIVIGAVKNLLALKTG